MSSRRIRIRFPLLLAVACCVSTICNVGFPSTADEVHADQPASSDATVIFARDVLPILSDNCFACHGPDDAQRQADLRLDQRDDALTVMVPGDAKASELFRRVTSEDPDLIMPPPESNHRLTTTQKDALKRWIDQGSVWGRHWSFEPLQRPRIPEASFADFPANNPIDLFVQRELYRSGLKPAVEADRRTLIRRLTLDLTGLPPTPEVVSDFLQDSASDAWEKLVDRVLDSPAYGERMAWDWLDAARYADSNGYQGDNDRTMWPWRDWVVQAFNSNLAFDQFTIQQLAGDLLPEATLQQQLATGFCRNHMINGEGGRIPEENRVDYVMDMTETMGTVWLGLTLNCCRCHDHKFDPLTQQNYYELFAFFNQTPIDGSGGNPATPPVIEVPSAEQRGVVQQLTERLKAAEKDSDLEKQLQQQLKDLRGAIPKVMVMSDRGEWRPTFILERGLYNQPTDREVSTALPAELSAPVAHEGQTMSRLDLARWLVSRENPLTARVTVNRFWQQIFGIGLVRTTEDFGVQGEYPLHKDLLDWLAADFVESGWDVKRLMRTIMTSHTYRQSSRITDTQLTDDVGRRLTIAEADPENRLLARGARYRLPSWMLRDQALAAGGLLSRTIGGPPVNTYQPEGVWEEATFGKKHYQRDDGAALYRRSLYVFWRRIIGPTMFFDNASRQTCMVRVLRTNTPLHALATLNDTTYVESARMLAQRLLLRDGASDAQRLEWAMEQIVSRPPAVEEAAVLLNGLERSVQHFSERPEAAEALLSVGEAVRDQSLPASRHAAWTSLCLALLNLDETLTRE